jgi:hypothetical protein
VNRKSQPVIDAESTLPIKNQVQNDGIRFGVNIDCGAIKLQAWCLPSQTPFSPSWELQSSFKARFPIALRLCSRIAAFVTACRDRSVFTMAKNYEGATAEGNRGNHNFSVEVV